MSLECITPIEVIDQYMRDRTDEITETLIRQLSYIGEAAISIARERGSYTDRTGNLRNSTGYVIAIAGEVVTTKGFKEGSSDFARHLASITSGNAVLVVSAGESYATYVSRRGYDVLDSAQLEAERIAAQIAL